MHTYDVVMQTSTGEVIEERYSVNWDPEKWTGLDVAAACAAEHTVAAGFDPNHMPRVKHVGLSAALVTTDEELQELTA